MNYPAYKSIVDWKVSWFKIYLTHIYSNLPHQASTLPRIYAINIHIAQKWTLTLQGYAQLKYGVSKKILKWEILCLLTDLNIGFNSRKPWIDSSY